MDWVLVFFGKDEWLNLLIFVVDVVDVVEFFVGEGFFVV